MTDSDWLARQFEAHRNHLRAVAYRMLGSSTEADDAVQEAWLRLSRTDPDAIDNLGGWLTTVVSRVSLDMLRARGSRREDAGADVEAADVVSVPDPAEDAVLADSVGAALLVVLDTLTPSERLAFVLHDMFGVPFEEVGSIVNRSTVAAKQLASRARRKVRGSDGPVELDPARQRAVVDAFLAASRNGEFEALVALLDPQIVLEADPAGVGMGSPEVTLGARAVAATFSGRALTAQPALIDGAVGMVWTVGGRPKVVWDFTVVGDKVVHITMIAAPETLADLNVQVLAG